jgi:TetR/AcrR family transcriptional regulator, repressor for neighboring sulfatase
VPVRKATEKHEAKRIRRAPDDARTLILDAADRVFAAHLPDAVGLKEVAREAGISRALITHYFGTYGGLVEAALERRFTHVRDTLVRELFGSLDIHADATDLLTAYRRALNVGAADPVTVRLSAWAMMNGRAGQEDFFARRVQGMKLLADALEQRTDLPREDLEFCLVASFALSVVWTVGGPWLTGALGRKKSHTFDPSFDERVGTMIDAYLNRPGK